MPTLVVCLIGLCGFVALAVDLGMLAVSRTESQNAADAAALAGARLLNNKPGVVDGNRPAALAISNATVLANFHLSTNFDPSQISSIRAGLFTYNTTTSKFDVSYPTSLPAGQSWAAIEVVITVAQPTYFMQVFGVTTMPSGARAVAVHRPRDTALVIDFTGSMGYSSLTNIYTGLNDPNAVWPAYGHYQRYTAYNTNALGASETGTVSTRPNPFQQMGTRVAAPYVYAPANLTIETNNGKPIVRDFYFAYTAANMADPSVPVTSPTLNADGTNNLLNAFQRWSPPETPGDPPNNIGSTFDYTGYDSTNNGSETNPKGPTPAPDNFKDQSDSPIPFVGDKSPRKYGATTGTTWDPTNTSGAAINAAEYLGWVAQYSSGSSLSTALVPATGGPNWSAGTGRTLVPNQVSPAGANFRDAVWERYGYDLDVNDYVTNRGVSWDPRWDWDSKANAGVGGWTHVRSANPVTSFRPNATAGKFKGYTMGPQYWGKTFFIWPPDPRWGNPDGWQSSNPSPTATRTLSAPLGSGVLPASPSTSNPVKDTNGNYICDWRRRFFLDRSGNTYNPETDADTITPGTQSINEEMFTSGTGATLRSPTGNWQTNYPAILAWIKSPPQVLPPNLRSGRVLYYSSIPNDVVVSGADSADVQADKVFWKTYIDYVLSTGALAGTEPVGWPEGVTPAVDQTGLVNFDIDSAGILGPDPKPYMNYTDNPSRPRMHFWFGPMTMLTFLHDFNMWSGTTHQAQSWQLKAGINSALDDIRSNHPNDWMGSTFFSNNDYNSIIVPMGQDWFTLKNALFFPRSILPSITSTTSTAEWRPYNATNGLQNTRGNIPNAQGSTDPVTGMSLAYNLLSPSQYVNTDPTRRGRRGATKMVIFETDGIPNSTQPFNLQKWGYDSYYTFGGTTPNTDPPSAATDVVTQIVKPALTTNGSGQDSGLSLPNAPARVYAIGFGDIFTTTAGPSAAAFLLSVQQKGNTSAATDTSIPSTQIITGSYQTRITNLRNALERICDSGVQVTLIE
jgi:hypothetical protein